MLATHQFRISCLVSYDTGRGRWRASLAADLYTLTFLSVVSACAITPSPNTYISFCNELNKYERHGKINFILRDDRGNFRLRYILKGTIRVRNIHRLALSNGMDMHLNFNKLYRDIVTGRTLSSLCEPFV